MRNTLFALLVLPALALAEGTPMDKTTAAPGPDAARVEKRLRLMRTLGLASALDLDAAQALKLGDTMAKFDARRNAIRAQARAARQTLRVAAQGGKATAAEVDGAIAKLLDLRAEGQALDKEMLQAVTQGLTPQQKARATLFLGSFRHGMDRHMMRGGAGPGRGHGPGMMGGRMGRGRGAGPAFEAGDCDGTGPCAGAGPLGRGPSSDDDAGELEDL